MECEPTDRLEEAKVATPEPFKVLVPMEVAPSLKVTVPVGVPPVLATVAVKVTEAPKVEGFRELASEVVLDA